MDNKEYIHRILNSVKDIDNIVDNFSDYNNIPSVEIDLLLSKIQVLYDNALHLKIVNAKKSKKKIAINEVEQEDIYIDIDDFDEDDNEKFTESKEKSVKKEPQLQNNIKETISEPTISKEEHLEGFQKAIKQVLDEEEKNEISTEKPIIEHEKPKTVDETQTTVVKNIEEPKQDNTIEKQPNIEEDVKTKAEPNIVEKIEKTKTHSFEDASSKQLSSINDIISANQTGNVLANKLNKKPLENINSAIGLNDKFQYIRELFDGVADNYSNTIDYLNSLKSFDEAMKYIETNFNWDTEDAVVVKFLEIVNRRFL
jgi:hypothetical protein